MSWLARGKNGVNVFGPLNNLGMGGHTYELMKADCRMFVPYHTGQEPEVALYPPFGQDRINNVTTQGWLANRIHSDFRRDISLMIFDAQFFPHFFGRVRVGFAVFEISDFTALQWNGIRSLDYILTPSHWGQEILKKNGWDSFVVNEGFDPLKFRTKPQIAKESSTPFEFLHVGKLEERKGTMQAIKCFCEAFRNNERTDMVLHCENPFLQDGGRLTVSDFLKENGFRVTKWFGPAQPNIWQRGLQRVLWSEPRNDMFELYRAADCGVFPSKGEGWGLPIMECVASGTPAIVGSWSGQSEYIRPGQYPDEILLTNPKIEKALDNVWFFGDRGDWFAPRDEDLILKMLWAYNNARNFSLSERWLNAVAGVRSFTWERAAGQLSDALSKI